jgi:hypothetical protein
LEPIPAQSGSTGKLSMRASFHGYSINRKSPHCRCGLSFNPQLMQYPVSFPLMRESIRWYICAKLWKLNDYGKKQMQNMRISALKRVIRGYSYSSAKKAVRIPPGQSMSGCGQNMCVFFPGPRFYCPCKNSRTHFS